MSQATGFWGTPWRVEKRVPDCSERGGSSLIRLNSLTGNHGKDAPPKGACTAIINHNTIYEGLAALSGFSAAGWWENEQYGTVGRMMPPSMPT